MKTAKTFSSLTFVAAAAVTVCTLGVVGTASASATNKERPTTSKRVMTKRTTDKVDVQALRRRPKLPREWVWKKYARTFDSMYRR